MIFLLVREIKLNREWYRMEVEYEGTAFRYTEESREMEKLIFSIDMALTFFGFINFVVIVFWLTSNYQALVDKWRALRGIKQKESIPWAELGGKKDETSIGGVD
ncbi:MAG: hypothetical protein AAF502_05100 [Bacteroidota bacterium]